MGDIHGILLACWFIHVGNSIWLAGKSPKNGCWERHETRWAEYEEPTSVNFAYPNAGKQTCYGF